jgi:uncharacterized membrane protein (DUF485 family)
MRDTVAERILRHPKYLELKRRRNALGYTLTGLMLLVYFGFIALIAFNKPFLAQPLGAGVTSLGVPIGLGVIVFTVLITGIYVFKANSTFDTLTQELMKETAK